MDNGSMWGIVYVVYICLIAPYVFVQSSNALVNKVDEKQVMVVFISWIIGLLLIMFLHFVNFNPIASGFLSILVAAGSYFVIKKFKPLL